MIDTACELLKELEHHHFKAYIVGGFARDYCLKRHSTDIDICTNATPKDLKNVFQNAILSSEQYGSVTMIYKNIRFEITTFRLEKKYIHHRIPSKIKYIQDLKQDLQRRDFTMNTLCIDSNGNILDLLNGKEDLERKMIRMVGNPKIRLKEDALRILRAVRFATVLNFTIDLNLKKYIKKYRNLLKELSYERKKEELDKIFASPNVAYGIFLLKELMLDEPLQLKGLDEVIITTDLVGIWAQLDVSLRYPFTSSEKEIIMKLKELRGMSLLDPWTLYHYGPYITTLAGQLIGIKRRTLMNAYGRLPIQSRKEIALDTLSICKVLGKKPGPYLKALLDDLEKKIVTGMVKNEEASIKNYLELTYLYH